MLASWSIAKRVFASFFVVLAIAAGLGALSYSGVLRISELFKTYNHAADQTLLIGDLATSFSETRKLDFRHRAQPSEEHVAKIDETIAGLLAKRDEVRTAFAKSPEILALVETAMADMAAYGGAFNEMSALQQQIDAQVANMNKAGLDFEQAVNGFLFGARISGDNKSAEHGNQAMQAFIRAVADIRAFLFSNDPELMKAAGPRLSEARSSLDSAASFQKIQGGDPKAALKAIEVLDRYIALAPEVAETIAQRNSVRADQLDVLGPKLLEAFDAARARVYDVQNQLGAAAQESSAQSQLVILTLSVAALAGGMLVAYLVGRIISGAVRGMATKMSSLAEGRLDVEITGAEHRHELGQMARALSVFKDNAARIEQMAQEREAQERAAADARREMMTGLREAFGVVVDAAVDGDFSQRIPATFPDAELNSLANGVNRLLDTVEEGVAETSRVLERIAEGDLQERMDGAFRGRLAALQHSVNTTVSRLSELVSDIAKTSGEVRGDASRISSDMASLSSRTEQQASSLQETAATTEEMSATVKTNAENSTRVSELAKGAADRAESGGEIVSRAVSAMTHIEESATKISDIISVIDGIAFQTNLLALNAAVEAARAGEAGKGFAVVASEVRTLAQRSADSSRDIRELIQESAGYVDEGVRLVKDTGVSLEGIVSAISDVESSVREMSAANREQAAGVEEISSAVSHMDEMTQENAAMADQSASSARNLLQGAEHLEQLVAFFKIARVEARADADWRSTEAAQKEAAPAEPKAEEMATPAFAPVQAAAGGADSSEFAEL